MSGPMGTYNLDLFTDAAGSTGYGYLTKDWSAAPWPAEWRDNRFLRNLVLLDLFPIILAMEVGVGTLII